MTEDEREDAQASWERHPFTLQTKSYFASRAEGALKDLLGKCEKSPDPEVAGAYQRWTSLSETAAYFKPRRKEGT